MNIWENAVITVKGLSLLSKLIEGDTLDITRAETGMGYVTPGTLSQLTSVSMPKQALTFRGLSYPEEGKCKLPCYLTNSGVTNGYTAKQVGVYATDPDEGEILFLIMQSPSDKGTEVPSETEMPGYSAEWNLYIQYGQASGVTVVVDATGVVSRGEVIALLDEQKEEIEKDVNSLLSAQKTEIENEVNNLLSEHEKEANNLLDEQREEIEAELGEKVSHDMFRAIATSNDGVTYTATIEGITSLYAGMTITIIPNKTSTSAETSLNLNGLVDSPIYHPSAYDNSGWSVPTKADWMSAGMPVRLTYTGSYWKTDIFNESLGGLQGTVSTAHGGTGKTRITKDSILVGNGTSAMTEKTMDELAEIMSQKLFTCSTEDIVAGETPLASGKFYLVYE